MTQIPSKSSGTPSILAPGAAHGGSDTRLLLKRLRDLMAGDGLPDERLNRVVRLIATQMVAEVCSVYLRRAGDVLELFATHGLNPEAVHRTRLRVGEGVVGDIAARARPLALADARVHPSFAYRPETGEEAYHSMLGVPILRNGKVIGVLAVQNRTQRHYSEDEIEALQTVAMVSAELIVGSGIVNAEEWRQADGIAIRPLRLTGVRLNGGPAMGKAVMHQPNIVVRTVIAEDLALEQERLNAALKGMYSAIDNFLRDKTFKDGEHREILETYRLIAEDRGWVERIKEAIGGGLTAEAAVQKVQDEMRARMDQIKDPYLRERMADFQDLANRLLQHLTTGVDSVGAPEEEAPPEHMIVVARSMGPAELLDYDRERLRGLVLEEGSPTSHVAIVARALDIPVVGRVAGILSRVEPLDTVIVDGDNGQVFVRPGEDVQSSFKESVRNRSRRRAAFAAMRDLPADTKDGTKISLLMNAGLLVDMQNLDITGAAGIGLYRTEIPFMVRSRFPEVEDQADLYARILDQAGDRPVVFRTLDIGGDKLLPYFDAGDADDNPAMGWRALRIALDRPAILRRQLRALIKAASGRALYVMFPMVSEVAEFSAARRLLGMELARATAKEQTLPASVSVGAMLEVPALVFQLPALLREADFLSVGSNDLLQFLFASDRGNPRLSQRYDPLAPATLNLLSMVAEQCNTAKGGQGVPLTLCGEMAGSPIDAMALIGLGFRRLSMAAPSIGPIKEMIRSLDLPALRQYMAHMQDARDHSLRHKLAAFARDHKIVI